MMAGGKELDELSAELEEFSRADAGSSSKLDPAAPPSTRSPNPCTGRRSRCTSTERYREGGVPPSRDQALGRLAASAAVVRS